MNKINEMCSKSVWVLLLCENYAVALCESHTLKQNRIWVKFITIFENCRIKGKREIFISIIEEHLVMMSGHEGTRKLA